MKLGSWPAKQKAGAERTANEFGFGAAGWAGHADGRWAWKMERVTFYVESREARTLESRKFLKLLRQPLILFEFMILCI